MNRDFVDMGKINELRVRFSGSQNRFVGPDPTFPIPPSPAETLDRYSRCFVTGASHVTKFNRNDFCVACDHRITVY